MLRISSFVAPLGLLFSSLLLTGCPEEVGRGCELNGELVGVGQRVELEDCNSCTCRSDLTLSCTDFTCEDPDPIVRDGGPGEGEGEGEDGGPPVDDCESECVDLDNDGFYNCIDPNCPNRPQVVDCDDDRFFVQPGGYEYPNNGFDDDCDETTPDDRAPCACTVTEDPSATDLINALDLCDDTVVSSSKTGDARQFAVMTDYFGDIFPEEGDCLAVLSNGVADEADVQAFGPENLCGGFGGCFADPDPENPGDDVWDLGQIRVTLRPPPNAKGVEFRFMFLSAEWPEFLCQSFNDTFYSLYESQAVNNGEVTNISFDPQQQQITVNVGFFEAPRDWSTSLDNTPFGEDDSASCGFPSAPECTLPSYCGTSADLDRVGSGSGWLTTRAPFDPGEESIDLVFSIHDEGDGILSSLVILDSLKWVPFRPPVGTVKE